MRQKIAILLFALCATATVNAQTGPMKASALGESTSVDELVGWTYWYNKTTTTDPTDDTSATRQTLANAGSTADRAYVCFTKVDDTHIKIYGMFEMPVEASVTFNSGKVSTIIIPCDQVIAYDKDKGEIKLSQKTWVSTLNDGAGGWYNYSDVRIYFGYNSNNSQYYWYVSNNWIQPYYMDGEEKVILKSYVPSGNYCYAYKAANVSGGVQYADWNAVMYTTYGTKNIHAYKNETRAVNVTQEGNVLHVQNFLGYGAGTVIDIDLHADNSISINNQTVQTSYTLYPATLGETLATSTIDKNNPIRGTGDTGKIEWGNYCRVNANNSGVFWHSSEIVMLSGDLYPIHFPVAMTMTDAGWASFSSEKALDFTGTGLTPYAVSEVDATNGAALLPVEGAVAPHTGLFVSGVADNYEIPTVADGNSLPTNALKATSQGEHTSDGQTYWGLGLDASSGAIGLKKMSAGSVAANKAYLIFDRAAAGAKSFLPFNFGGTTAIEGSLTPNPSPEGKGNLYNLQGQRVGEGYRGIVIKNGKKVVIR